MSHRRRRRVPRSQATWAHGPDGLAAAPRGEAEVAPASVATEATPRAVEPPDPGERALPPPELDAAPATGTAGQDLDSRIEPHEVALAVPRHHRLVMAFSITGLAIAAFVTGLFLFNNLVMPRLIHSSAEVRVPDLANLTFEQAEQLASTLHLQLSRAGERFDPSVPAGFILSQDPPEGTPVRGRRRIMVVVSLGEEFSSVPELFGESLRGARLLIEHAGLRVGGITRAPSDEVGEGLVVASDPPAESVLPRNTPVGLLLSSGSGPELFVMPDLLGREISGVRRQLEALGFRVVTPPAAPSVGAIVTQDPAPGSRITRDVSITLQATGRLIR